MWPVIRPFSVSLEGSGERNLFHSTSGHYPAKGSTRLGDHGVPLPRGVDVARGSDGELRGGTYFMNRKGETHTAGKTTRKYREEGMPETVWKHIVDLLQRSVQ